MFRTRTLAVLVGAALATVAAPAAAQSAQPSLASTERTPAPVDGSGSAYTTRWYGGETLAADALSYVTAAVGGAVGSRAVAYTGLAGFVVATPIIHFTHGNVGAGFASLGLRAGLPALGVAGLYLCPVDQDAGFHISGCQLGSLMLGVGLDVLVVPPVDAAVFAHERVRKRPEIGLVPMIDRHQAGLAIGGAF